MNTSWGAAIPGDLIPDWIEVMFLFLMFLSVCVMLRTPYQQHDEFKLLEAQAMKFRHNRKEELKTEDRTYTGESKEEARQRRRRLKHFLRR